MYRNPVAILDALDAEVGRKLTREQCLAIIAAPPRVRLLSLCERFNVRLTLIKHVRYTCKWMAHIDRRPAPWST